MAFKIRSCPVGFVRAWAGGYIPAFTSEHLKAGGNETFPGAGWCWGEVIRLPFLEEQC